VVAHAMAGSAVVLLILLVMHPESRFYPACPIHELLHVQCPGCGATRALVALLHGHLRVALEANALFVCALPFVLFYAGWSYCRLVGSRPFVWPSPSTSLIRLTIAVTVVFTVARNLL
jgi:hypothetical protein